MKWVEELNLKLRIKNPQNMLTWNVERNKKREVRNKGGKSFCVICQKQTITNPASQLYDAKAHLIFLQIWNAVNKKIMYEYWFSIFHLFAMKKLIEIHIHFKIANKWKIWNEYVFDASFIIINEYVSECKSSDARFFL